VAKKIREAILDEVFLPGDHLREEVLIELYRKGEIDEAVRTFRKIYIGLVDQLIDHLNTRDRRPPMLKRPSKKTARNMADKARRSRRLG
jgi:hypothetical protein